MLFVFFASIDPMSAPNDGAAVDYLRSNEIPQVLDEAVAALLKDRPGSKDEVLANLAEYALKSLPTHHRARVAKSATPSYTRSVAEADISDSIIAHNLNHPLFADLVKQTAPAQEDPEGPSALQRSYTITSYNTAGSGGVHHQPHERFVKTIGTIGPASDNEMMLQSMIVNGLSVARLNLSHGTLEEHANLVRKVRQAAGAVGRSVAIAIDTRGAEIRLGPVPGGDIWKLKDGDKVIISTDEAHATNPPEGTIFVTWKDITKRVEIGQRVCVADGLLQLTVDNKTDTTLECRCENDFELGGGKNVNLPGVVVDIPILNDADKADFDFAIEQGITLIFLSFVQSAKEIVEVRKYFAEKYGEKGNDVSIIAKVENQAGLQQLDDIILESDGIMVARGDLGSELPIQKLFVCQKSMIAKCNVAGKPVIVSAQLMESMVTNSQPTRAEASDVANAVLDGADALMLSAETAVGNHPVTVVRTLGNLTYEAQRYLPRNQLFKSMCALQPRPFPSEESIGSSAVNTANELGAKVIITLTTAGSSARLISKYFPPCPVLAVCKKESTYNFLHLVRGVVPYRYDGVEKDERLVRLEKTIKYLKEEVELLREGDTVVLVHADLFGPPTGNANVCRVWIVQ